jgi:hypothetical protein
MPTKEEFIAKAEAILKQGNLSPDDMAVWQGVFERVSPAAVSLFINIMQADTSMLALLTDNLKKKIAAGDDHAKIQEIVNNERAQLQELMKS